MLLDRALQDPNWAGQVRQNLQVSRGLLHAWSYGARLGAQPCSQSFCILQIPLRLTLAASEVTSLRFPEPLYVSMLLLLWEHGLHGSETSLW